MTGDDLPALIAILKGARQAYESTRRVPTLIHTVGFTEPAQGKCAAAINSDMDISKLKSVAPMALRVHRNANCVLIGADEQGDTRLRHVETWCAEPDCAGYVRTHIMMPGIVFGVAHGPVFDRGIAQPFSIHIPALIKCSLDRRRGAMFGPGESVWPVIHIDDGA